MVLMQLLNWFISLLEHWLCILPFLKTVKNSWDSVDSFYHFTPILGFFTFSLFFFSFPPARFAVYSWKFDKQKLLWSIGINLNTVGMKTIKVNGDGPNRQLIKQTAKDKQMCYKLFKLCWTRWNNWERYILKFIEINILDFILVDKQNKRQQIL